MKTSELQGAALDWAVAKCEGHDNVRVKERDDLSKAIVIMEHTSCPDNKPGCAVMHLKGTYYDPTTNWSQGGPILDREKMMLEPYNDQWRAHKFTDEPPFIKAFGPTMLTAGLRCFIASRLGDEVDVPEELK